VEARSPLYHETPGAEVRARGRWASTTKRNYPFLPLIARGDHCESVADGKTSVRYKAIARCPGNWLLCLTPVMQQRFFADRNTNSSPMTMTSPLEGAAGLIRNSGRNTADACDTNASETNADTSPHLICIAKPTVTELRTPLPVQVPL
jgi:hypothetical protein